MTPPVLSPLLLGPPPHPPSHPVPAPPCPVLAPPPILIPFIQVQTINISFDTSTQHESVWLSLKGSRIISLRSLYNVLTGAQIIMLHFQALVKFIDEVTWDGLSSYFLTAHEKCFEEFKSTSSDELAVTRKDGTSTSAYDSNAAAMKGQMVTGGFSDLKQSLSIIGILPIFKANVHRH